MTMLSGDDRRGHQDTHQDPEGAQERAPSSTTYLEPLEEPGIVLGELRTPEEDRLAEAFAKLARA